MGLFWMYCRRTLGKPAIVILWGSIPFVFMTIYMLAFGRSGSIAPSVLALVDEDSSFVSSFVKQSFSYEGLSSFVSVKEVASLEDAEALFRNGAASGALLIPKGFGDDLLQMKEIHLTLYSNPRHYYGPQILEGITDALVTIGNGLISQFADPLQAIAGFSKAGTTPNENDVADISRKFFTAGRNMPALASIRNIDVTIAEKKSGETMEFNFAALAFPGLIVFSLLFLSLSTEARFLRDKLHKLNNRIITAPRRPALLVLNQRLYSIVFLYVVAVVCAGIGGLVWHIPATGLLTVNIITIGLILFIVGLNATTFGLARSLKGGAGLSSFLMVALLMIGGGMMPVESYPESIQRISHLTPVGLANTGIVEALTGRAVSISIPGLLLYGAAFLVLSIVIGRKRLT
jgi:ABC-type multidrug transport system permease subunit